jgi:hypothetical protein
LLSFCLVLFVLGFSAPARAEPGGAELSASAGLGVLAAGVTPGRFAVSPSLSLLLRGSGPFFMVRDTVALVGAAGGPLGVNNEATLGGGYSWERVNLSAGLLFSIYSLPMCGRRLCATVQGVAPGAAARIDIFGPYLAGALGISGDCSATWISGRATPVWSGFSVRCSAGPILRLSSKK